MTSRLKNQDAQRQQTYLIVCNSYLSREIEIPQTMLN